MSPRITTDLSARLTHAILMTFRAVTPETREIPADGFATVQTPKECFCTTSGRKKTHPVFSGDGCAAATFALTRNTGGSDASFEGTGGATTVHEGRSATGKRTGFHLCKPFLTRAQFRLGLPGRFLIREHWHKWRGRQMPQLPRQHRPRSEVLRGKRRHPLSPNGLRVPKSLQYETHAIHALAREYMNVWLQSKNKHPGVAAILNMQPSILSMHNDEYVGRDNSSAPSRPRPGSVQHRS